MARISREKYGLFLLLYGQIVGTVFEGDVRPAGAVHLHLILHRKRRRVLAGLLGTIFPDFVKKFAGGDKLYFPLFFCPVHC